MFNSHLTHQYEMLFEVLLNYHLDTVFLPPGRQKTQIFAKNHVGCLNYILCGFEFIFKVLHINMKHFVVVLLDQNGSEKSTKSSLDSSHGLSIIQIFRLLQKKI